MGDREREQTNWGKREAERFPTGGIQDSREKEMSRCREMDNFSCSHSWPSPDPPQPGQGVRAAPTSSSQLSTTCSEAEAFLASEGKDPPSSLRCWGLPGWLCSALAHAGATSKLQVRVDRRVQRVDLRARLPVWVLAPAGGERGFAAPSVLTSVLNYTARKPRYFKLTQSVPLIHYTMDKI